MTMYASENKGGHLMLSPRSQHDNPASPGSREVLAVECKFIAEELLRVLQLETSCLREFNSQELLRVLPTKELLLRELRLGLKSLQLHRTEVGEEQNSPHLADLRKSLEDVHRANRFNEVFIKGSLDYWQGLMTVFSPQTYGPGPGLPPSQPGPAARGFTFSKEA